MAKYIEVNRTIDYITKHTKQLAWYDEDGYLVDDEKATKHYTDLIEGIKTADVVEHSKIDKAIAEIEVEIKSTFDFAEKEILYRALEILKRNIGE